MFNIFDLAILREHRFIWRNSMSLYQPLPFNSPWPQKAGTRHCDMLTDFLSIDASPT